MILFIPSSQRRSASQRDLRILAAQSDKKGRLEDDIHNPNCRSAVKNRLLPRENCTSGPNPSLFSYQAYLSHWSHSTVAGGTVIPGPDSS